MTESQGQEIPITKAVARFLKSIAQRGGKARAAALTPEERAKISRKGSRARVKALTPEQRSRIARKAAKARWKKK